jgi:hypothetical protein
LEQRQDPTTTPINLLLISIVAARGCRAWTCRGRAWICHRTGGADVKKFPHGGLAKDLDQPTKPHDNYKRRSPAQGGTGGASLVHWGVNRWREGSPPPPRGCELSLREDDSTRVIRSHALTQAMGGSRGSTEVQRQSVTTLSPSSSYRGALPRY